MSDELVEVKPEFYNPQSTGYTGGFPDIVERRIRSLVGSPSVHLFSGTSDIGDVRVDLERPEATVNADVFDFIAANKADYKWMVADPPYDIARSGQKLKRYASSKAVYGTVAYQQIIERFIQEHCENVLWFDYCSPKPKGFTRKQVWVFITIGMSWFKPRLLTWIQREGERLA